MMFNIELFTYGGRILIECIYEALKQIWVEEREIEKVAKIKKGKKEQLCENYRIITLLNIVCNNNARSLRKQVNNIIVKYKWGFMKSKSTPDGTHILKQIMKK